MAMIITHEFMDKKDVVGDQTTRDESRLVFINQRRKMVFDTIRNNLADTFVNNITASYRTKISDFGRGVNLRDESKNGVVERLKKFAK